MATLDEQVLVVRYLFNRKSNKYPPFFGDFEPPKKGEHVGKLSVYMVDNLKPEQIWEIGDFVKSSRPPSLKGRTLLTCGFVRKLGLSVIPDPLPGEKFGELHALITDWPICENEENRDTQWQQLATQLALCTDYLAR